MSPWSAARYEWNGDGWTAVAVLDSEYGTWHVTVGFGALGAPSPDHGLDQIADRVRAFLLALPMVRGGGE